MEIRNLATFLQVADTKNFTKASRLLGYSQSNVSTQIRQLEADVGAKLFDRIGRGVVLTQFGEELLPYARQIVAAADQMENFLRPETEMGGTIRIGMVESLLGECFEPLLLNFTARFPNVKIDLIVDATATLQEMLQKNEIDIACLIDDPLPRTKWQCKYVKQVEILPLAGAGHPLAGRPVTPAEVCREKVILMEATAPYTKHVHRWAAIQNLEVNGFLTLQNPRMAAQLLQNSRYISFLPDYAVREKRQKGLLVRLDVIGWEETQEVQVILHRNKVLTPQLKGFLEETIGAFDRVLSS